MVCFKKEYCKAFWQEIIANNPLIRNDRREGLREDIVIDRQICR
jgi:hypothetical protein